MRLTDVAAVSREVGAASGRLDKIGRLADLLGRVPPDELVIVTAFLSGGVRQGRIGVGRAQLSAMRDVPAAPAPDLEIADVDRAFDRLAAATGAGSTGARAQILRGLFGRATGRRSSNNAVTDWKSKACRCIAIGMRGQSGR